MRELNGDKKAYYYDVPKVVAVSGGFDPLHSGHLNYIREAKQLGDKLVVILNADRFLLEKKGFAFMPYEERKYILEHIREVDEVIPCIDEDQTVSKTLAQLKPTIFAKGGDRTPDNLPKSETDICHDLGIQLVFGVGGNNEQSSSRLVRNAKEKIYNL